MGIGEIIQKFLGDSGVVQFFVNNEYGWKNAVMLIIACVLLYLAIFRDFEPYLLIPIAFGMLLVNFPVASISDKIFVYTDIAEFDAANGAEAAHSFIKYDGHYFGGLLGYLYLGVKTGIYPCLIFLGIGATTDFGPLIANPKSMLLGAAAQIGIFITFVGAVISGFTAEEASSIGIIGGADGPTAILVTTKLAPDLLPAISVAAYSYMALVPVIQPPIIRLLTTKKERAIKMKQLRPVSKIEKILFPIVVSAVAILLVPSCAQLVGCLMLGNLFKESGVVPHLVDTAGNALLYIVTILLGVCVGATANGQNFLQPRTIMIFGLGIAAFAVATASGVLGGKLMCKLTGGKVNPMIGAAGVSAVPMAARVVQKEGQREDPTNFLLMHAMGPNVAGVIGSAIAAGILLSMFG